jgi:hypothetical protein
MIDWRNANEATRYLQTNFKRKTKLVNLLKEATQLEEEMAQEFVDTMLIHYPQVKEHFKRLGITDVITQAYYCEVFLEMLPCEKFHQVLKKAGIDVSQKAHVKKLEQRKQKKEQKDEEEQSEKFIYDGRFSNALNQLTLKIRGLNPRNKKHKQRIPVETIMLAKEIWLMLEEERKQNEDGRVGEALDWVTGPLEREGYTIRSPSEGAPAEAGARAEVIRPWSKAPNTRPY